MPHRPAFVPLTGAPPAVAVPVQASDAVELLQLTAGAIAAGADLIEWRVDALSGHDGAQATDLVGSLRAVAGGVPLLGTFRSRAEGGPGVLDDAGYRDLLLALVAAGIDAVDVELSRPEEDVADVVVAAHAGAVAVIGSSHDFEATPDDLGERWRELARRGADVLKVATMPHSAADVLRLLTSAVTAREQLGRPVVPVAMGPLGVMSRVAGELWQAPFTFAAVGAASAPGQLSVAEVREVQRVLGGSAASGGDA